MEIEDGQVIFSSGRKRYAHRGLLAIEADPWFISYGYDSGLWSQAQNEFDLHARAILGLPVDTRRIAHGASAVIYGGVEAKGIHFEHVDQALLVPHSDLRLFGKPESYRKRRMGVALATAENVDEARGRAKECAARVHPVA